MQTLSAGNAVAQVLAEAAHCVRSGKCITPLAMEPPPSTHLTVVLDRPVAIYSGMVPGFVAGQYSTEELEIDVVPLARRAMARVILSAATRIDAEQRLVHLEGRPPIRYDVASVDIGSTVTGFGLMGHLARDVVARAASARCSTFRGSPRSLDCRALEGLRSTFHPENEKAKKGIIIQADAQKDPRLELLFDPQTSGGLTGYPQSLIDRVYKNAETRRIAIVPNRRVCEATSKSVDF